MSTACTATAVSKFMTLWWNSIITIRIITITTIVIIIIISSLIHWPSSLLKASSDQPRPLPFANGIFCPRSVLFFRSSVWKQTVKNQHKRQWKSATFCANGIDSGYVKYSQSITTSIIHHFIILHYKQKQASSHHWRYKNLSLIFQAFAMQIISNPQEAQLSWSDHAISWNLHNCMSDMALCMCLSSLISSWINMSKLTLLRSGLLLCERRVCRWAFSFHSILDNNNTFTTTRNIQQTIRTRAVINLPTSLMRTKQQQTLHVGGWITAQLDTRSTVLTRQS